MFPEILPFVVLCLLLDTGNGQLPIPGEFRTEIRQEFNFETYTSAPTVILKQGPLRGFFGTTISGRRIATFRAIPYGTPPIGPLRFQAVATATAWAGVLDATVETPACVQLDFISGNRSVVKGQEDCLYLEVHTPHNDIIKNGQGYHGPLPVLVWFHGGSFASASASLYGPYYLLNEDVILVTVNYRLGPFGFLSTASASAWGNVGLKDQVLALQWIRDNIAKFGGNPDSVTIFGVDAGAVAVQHHILSDLSRGLFHRAISHSGNSLAWWALQQNPVALAIRTGALFNCFGSLLEIVECLQKVPAVDLVKAQLNLATWNIFPTVIFGPVIEPIHPGAFLTENPVEIYRQRRAASVPWITGFTRYEMSSFVAEFLQNDDAVEELNRKWDELGQTFLALDQESEEMESEQRSRNVSMESEFRMRVSQNVTETFMRNKTEVSENSQGMKTSRREQAKKIRNYYLGENNTEIGYENRQKIAQMLGDRDVMIAGLDAINLHAKYSGESVYAYEFSYEGMHSNVEMFWQNAEDWGVSRYDDIIYLLNSTEKYPTIDSEMEQEDYQMSELMTSTWANFATYGKPYIGKTTKIQTTWETALTAETASSQDWVKLVKFLSLELPPKMIQNPYTERYRFWSSLQISS